MQKQIRKNIYFYSNEVDEYNKIVKYYKKIDPNISESNIIKNIIFQKNRNENKIDKILLQNKIILEEIGFNSMYVKLFFEFMTDIYADEGKRPQMFMDKNPLEFSNLLFQNVHLEKMKKEFYKKIELKEKGDDYDRN